jgi:hypothetical protein
MSWTPVANVIKLFSAIIYDFRNKLERLSLASLFSLVLCLRLVEAGAYPRVEHLNGATLR